MKKNLIITIALVSGLALQAVNQAGSVADDVMAAVERGGQAVKDAENTVKNDIAEELKKIGTMQTREPGQPLFEEDLMMVEEQPVDEIEKNALEVQK